jgi:large subunit ribosomal protein L6
MENLFYISTLHIPSTVQVTETFHTFQFSGPLGILEYRKSQIDSLGLAFTFLEAKSLQIFVKKTSKNSKSLFGSLQTFYTKIFHGVSQGFLVSLELVGVGFRAFEHQKTESKSDSTLESSSVPLLPDEFSSHHLHTISSLVEFKIGQSHQIIAPVPQNLRVFYIKPTILSFYGLDHNQLTQFTANIRKLRLPDPYKGKGIRVKGQVIPLKIGKKKS